MHFNKKTDGRRGALRKEVRLSYIRLAASYMLKQLYDASHRDIVLRTVLEANISPQDKSCYEE